MADVGTRGAAVTTVRRACWLVLLSFACGASLPRPMTTAHPASAFYEVPYPPPPGRVEIVPPWPGGALVWLDGEWRWDGSRWVWQPGAWVNPPRGARYARWETTRLADGRLLFAPGAWVYAAGRETAP